MTKKIEVAPKKEAESLEDVVVEMTKIDVEPEVEMTKIDVEPEVEPVVELEAEPKESSLVPVAEIAVFEPAGGFPCYAHPIIKDSTPVAWDSRAKCWESWNGTLVGQEADLSNVDELIPGTYYGYLDKDGVFHIVDARTTNIATLNYASRRAVLATIESICKSPRVHFVRCAMIGDLEGLKSYMRSGAEKQLMETPIKG